MVYELKSDCQLPKKFLFACFNERPLKIMKNAFYFILKALFVLKIIRFLSWHFHHEILILGVVSLSHFVYDFSRKIFLMLYSINWPNSLPLLLEILVNMCIAIVYEPGCDIIDFEINLIFLIKPFSYMTKKSRQKFKYLENEKSF